MDELLKNLGVTRESLTKEERETVQRWAQQLSTKQMGFKDLQEYINNMIAGVERELTGYDTPQTFTSWLFRGKRNTYLSARLHNYILLRDFLTAPEKAKRYVEAHLQNLTTKG